MSNVNQSELVRALWSGNRAFATSLLILYIDKNGTEGITWTPYTIRMEIEEEFKVEPSYDSFNKLMAGISLVTSNSFYSVLPDFVDLCNVLSGELISPGVFVPADSTSCAWGITEAMLISPPEDPKEGFSDDIKNYVTATLKNEGILIPPDILKFDNFDKDILQKLKFEFSDDEEMFQSIYSAEQSKTEDINNFVKNNLSDLIEQLSLLPLKHGNSKKIAHAMLEALSQSQAEREL